MKSHISTNSLSVLRQKLPVNGMETIAEKMNVSLSTVSRVMNGITLKRQTEIVAVAIEVIKEEKDRIAKLKTEIDSL